MEPRIKATGRSYAVPGLPERKLRQLEKEAAKEAAIAEQERETAALAALDAQPGSSSSCSTQEHVQQAEQNTLEDASTSVQAASNQACTTWNAQQHLQHPQHAHFKLQQHSPSPPCTPSALAGNQHIVSVAGAAIEPAHVKHAAAELADGQHCLGQPAAKRLQTLPVDVRHL
eukprot:jgi/Chrzof1/1773/Cz10g20180.t1